MTSYKTTQSLGFEGGANFHPLVSIRQGHYIVIMCYILLLCERLFWAHDFSLHFSLQLTGLAVEQKKQMRFVNWTVK